MLDALQRREEFLEAKGLSRRTAPLLIANGFILEGGNEAPWPQLAMYALQSETQRLQVRLTTAAIRTRPRRIRSSGCPDTAESRRNANLCVFDRDAKSASLSR